MTTKRGTRWLRNGAAMACAVVAFAACAPSPIDTGDLNTDPFVVVSLDRNASALEATYFSLPAGSLPNALGAVIRVVHTSTSVSVSLVDGGFDPVLLPAAPGDSIRVTVTQNGGGVVAYAFTVPSKPGPPVVIRTEPAPHKRDVPLNATLRVVFSEPIDALTLTNATVQVRTGSTLVSGNLAFVDASHTAADFTPAGLLTANSDYELVVTQGIKDLGGDPLAGAVSVPFTTGIATNDVDLDRVRSIVVSPLAVTVDQGAPFTLSATLRNSAGTLLTYRRVTDWQSSAPNVAAITSEGVVTGLSQGSATITARIDGVFGTGTITVTANNPDPVDHVFISADNSVVPVGRSLGYYVLLRGADNRPVRGQRPITIQTSNVAIATIGAQNQIIGVAPGSATITATSEGKSGTLVVTVVALDRFESVTTGADFSCSVTFAGRAFCWGSNTAGQLGNGSTVSSSSPVEVAGGLRFASISAGRAHACGVTTDHVAYCWGENAAGQLGNQNNVSSAAPIAVFTSEQFVQISAGGNHSCGVAVDRKAYCWGDNSSGQLGIGSTTNRNTPALVASGFSSISAGGSHTCGVVFDSNITSYCWGLNASGQLGTGTTTNSSIPVVAAGGFQFGYSYWEISAGKNHTCASSWCWGDNSSGQLGDGSTTNAAFPVVHNVPTGYEDVVVLRAGGSHTCAVTDAPVSTYCWGNNSSGQLGIGSTASQFTPTATPGGANSLRFTAMRAGDQHTCGVTRLGIVYCWGSNASGQLGDGTTSGSTSPIKVLGQP